MAEFGGYIDPNYPNPNGSGDASIIIYGYIPSIPLCALGIALSAILFAAHLFRTSRSRAWYTVPLVVSCFMECLGYIFRTLSAKIDPYRVSFFVAQYFLITTTPILITASLYFCLTKILAFLEAEKISVPLNKGIGPRLILWVFITADVITTAVQVAGAGLIGSRTSNHKNPATANDIVLAGISIQTFFFCIYLGLFAVASRSVWRSRDALPEPFNIAIPVIGLASVAILVRLVFRIAETGEGVFGFLSTHEAFLGALDFVPVMIALALLAAWHPGMSLKLRPHASVEKPAPARAL